MASDNPGADVPATQLQTKYADLCRKYAALVERLERRNSRHIAVFQLGRWGLQMRGAALVMVRGGQIVLANARFAQLSSRARGRWLKRGDEQEAFSDLRQLVLEQARRISEEERPVEEALFRHETLDLHLSLRGQAGGTGKDSFVAVLLEDVTEDAHRDHELVRTREALLQRERVRVLGELAAAVAHDLGNTLRGASFQIAALGRSGDETLSGVARRVEVASQVVSRLHDFARGGSFPTGAVSLRDIIDQATALAEIELREDKNPIRVERVLPDLPRVRGSGAELSLLFVNLLRNARDAMPGGGTVTIAGRLASALVHVEVADEGSGIPPENLPRMFQPFFTTKAARGTGLGLWLAKGTMERLGGDIRVANRPRGGTVFSLTFPLAGGISPDRARKTRAPEPGGRSSPASPRPRRARRGGSRT